MKTISYNKREFLVDETGFGRYWLDMEKGIWEPWTFVIFERFLRKDTIYIDLGLWIGMTILYAAKICDQCYGFEPDPVAYKTVCKNMATSGIKNAHIFNEAVFNYDGMLTLGCDSPLLGNAITRVGESHNTFQVPCCRLETFSAREGLNGPMFIKIDVEGAEEYILKDIEFFQKRKPIVYLSTHESWFINPVEAMATIKRVSMLYKHCLHQSLWVTTVEDGARGFGGLLFTDNL